MTYEVWLDFRLWVIGPNPRPHGVLVKLYYNAAKSQDVLKFQEIKYILNTLRNFSEPNFL